MSAEGVTYEAFDLEWAWDESQGKFIVEKRNVRLRTRRGPTPKLPKTVPPRSDLAAPLVSSDIAPYTSPICNADGVHPVIDGKAAQREDLKRNGCRIKEPSETLARAGAPKPREPVITKAMERTAVETYERITAQQNR